MNKISSIKKEVVFDIAKDVLIWAAVTGLALLYWTGVLLLASLLLLNVWTVSFDEIVKISIILTIVTSIGYLAIIIYRKSRN